MALRNAFDAIATEGTLRRLVDQLRFSRDSTDRLRVIFDNNPGVTINSGTVQANVFGHAANGIIQATVAPFHGQAWNANDARHEMQEMTLQSFQITRNRWSIT